MYKQTSRWGQDLPESVLLRIMEALKDACDPRVPSAKPCCFQNKSRLQTFRQCCGSLRTTCKHWRDLHDLLVEELAPSGLSCAHHMQLEPFPKNMPQCLDCFPNLKTLHLEGLRCGVTDEGIRSIGRLSGLKTLNLNICNAITDNGVRALGELSSLTSLELRVCPQRITLKDLRMLQSRRAHAATPSAVPSPLIHLSDVHGFSTKELRAIGSLATLQRLDLSGVRGITDEGVQELGGLRSLASLHLAKWRGISELGVAALCGLTSLVDLGLHDCEGLTDMHVSAMGVLVNLESLQLSRCCQKVTDKGVRVFGSLSALTSLDIAPCPMLTDSGVQALGGLSSLTQLNLANSPLVTDDGVRTILKIASLTSVNLRLCEGVSIKGLSSLSSRLSQGSLQYLDWRCMI